MKYSLFVLIICFVIQVKSQTNYKYENFGNRSILLNGNVTGSVDDLGATYYNPARLALIEDPVFAINAKIYELIDVKIENYLFDKTELSSSDFKGLPSMVSGTFKIKFLKNHQFAYALISRNRYEVDLSFNTGIVDNEFNNELPGVAKYFASTNLNYRLRENWFGLSWAKSITSNFSLGASLFASYYNYSAGNSDQFTSINDLDQVTNHKYKVSFDQKSYGAFLKIGAAWVFKSIEFGLNIDLPYLEVYSEGSFYNEEVLSGSNNGVDIFSLNNLDDVNAKRIFPMGISLGGGIPFKKNKLHLNISWNSAVDTYDRLDIPTLESITDEEVYRYKFEEKLSSIVNFGMGAEIYINPIISAFGSFSTDFSPFDIETSIIELASNSENRVNTGTDFYHYGLGVNFGYKRVNFILGTVYTHGKSDFLNSNDENIFPELLIDQIATIKQSRWRFLIGFEILFLNRQINVGKSTKITKQEKVKN